MSFEFEQALRRKCQENPDLSVLASQWDYDKRLVSDALQIVGLTFPHYSRHDATHSNTILVQLARVLGVARIEMLSATDIWLLLEAAYQHDIGMVVTTEQAKKWWDSKEFKGFLDILRTGSDVDLRRAAEILADGTRAGELGSDWPLQVAHARTLVLAEYARRQHATNADRIIRDPERTIGLLSPRTPLIPARLFRLLGRICSHHGRSFDDTMNLPLQESGLGTDDAHPRFVACLLRLGDLLDLDNGRFCPVMVRSFGTLPASSMAHFEKHAAINHLQVSPTQVEVEAECESYEAYEVTDQWLEWLRSELKNQMARWSEIVTSPNFGALPSLGKIQAHIRGYLSLEPGRRPRFEVDREQILRLVQGANIYSDRLGCMRELLQNAVDATLVRLWSEQWSRKSREELVRLTPKELRQELENYPIKVGFQKVEAQGDSEKARWCITVEDNGTGISLNDVRYIQRIGSSQKNPDRQRLIREMPEWMRPSGIFGIGLQSVFLFTDKVFIRTRHFESRETLELTLQNGPNSNADGLSIREIEGDSARIRVGTRIEFYINTDRMPTARPEMVEVFDPMVEKDPEPQVEAPQEIVLSFARACACPVEVQWGQKQVRKEGAQDLFVDSYFDPGSNLEVAFKMDVDAEFFTPSVALYYRGAPVNSRVADQYGLLRVYCNIHQGRADDLLLLSRERFTSEGGERIRSELDRLVKRFFPEFVKKMRANKKGSSELGLASLRAWLFSLDAAVAGDEWRRVSIGEEGSKRSLTLGELISKKRVDLLLEDRKSGRPEVLRKTARYAEILASPYRNGWLIESLVKQFAYVGFDVRGDESEVYGTEVLVFGQRSSDAPITTRGLRLILQEIETSGHAFGSRRRMTIPCPLEYMALSYGSGANVERFFVVQGYVSDRMVCPFVWDYGEGVVLPNLAKWVEWTARNADGGPRPESEVAKALWRFIQDADSLMDGRWKEKGYDLASTRRELAHWLD